MTAGSIPPLVRRPLAADDEDEEDLLRMQSEFMASSSSSSSASLKAAASSKTSSATSSKAAVRGVIWADQESHKDDHKDKDTKEQNENNEPPQISKVERRMPVFEQPGAPASSILAAAVAERTFDPHSHATAPAPSPANSTGFPLPKHRSLWAPKRPIHPPRPAATKISTGMPPIASERHMVESAAKENDARIAAMSPAQIDEARREILAKLDSSAIAFLETRRLEKASAQGDRAHADSVAPAADSTYGFSGNGHQETEHQPLLHRVNLDHTTTRMHPSPEIESASSHPIPIKTTAAGPESIQMNVTDPSQAEPEKLEWMRELDSQSTNDQESSDKSSLRFDFAGCILLPDAANNTPVHSGLFHHGKQAPRPGYAIEELAHLSKSTVPMQRSLSIRTLARIVARLHAGFFDLDQSAEICSLFCKHDVLLQFRVAFDASHETVIIHALEALACFLGHPPGSLSPSDLNNDDSVETNVPSENSLWDRLALGRLNLRAFDLSPKSLALFSAKAHGKDDTDFELPKNDGSLAGVSKLTRKDPVLGLLSTHMLVRIHYLINTTQLPSSTVLDIVHILTAFARHSASAAQDVLECAGLVDAITRKVAALGWPLSETSLVELTLARDTIRLFHVLCQSGRDAAASLVRHGIVGTFMRYLTMPPSVSTETTSESIRSIVLKYEIASLVWLLQASVYMYGLGGQLFDEYRILFFESLERAHVTLMPMLMSSVHDTKPVSDDTSERTVCLSVGLSLQLRDALLVLLASIARAFSAVSLRFRAQVDAGGPNDAVRPYADVFMGLLEALVAEVSHIDNNNGCDADTTMTTAAATSTMTSVCGSVCVSATLDVLHTYISQSLTYQYAPRAHVVETLRRVTVAVTPIVNTLMQADRISAAQNGIARAWDSAHGLMQIVEKTGTGLPLCTTGSRRVAHALLQFGAMCDAVASALDIDLLSLRHLAKDRSGDNGIALMPFCVKAVGLVTATSIAAPGVQTAGDQSVGEWMRVFGHGKPMLLFMWSKSVVMAARKSSNQEKAVETAHGKLVALAGVVGLSDLVPGDEYVAAEWLNGYMFSGKPGCPVSNMDASLSHVFALDAFMGAALDQSRALYRNDDHERLESLVFSASAGAGSLPLRRDWVFGPIDRLYRELATHGLASVPDDIEAIVRRVLAFVRSLSETESLDAIDPAVKVVHLMRVFLLCACDGSELFRKDGISEDLDWCFDVFVLGRVRDGEKRDADDGDGMDAGVFDRVVCGLEKAAGGGTALYRLYQEVLDQYASASFSALHFQKYLAVMLAMTLSVDYRAQFWTTLEVGLMRGFVYEGNAGLMRALTKERESDERVLSAMRKARVALVDGTLLARVVDAHLRGKSAAD